MSHLCCGCCSSLGIYCCYLFAALLGGERKRYFISCLRVPSRMCCRARWFLFQAKKSLCSCENHSSFLDLFEVAASYLQMWKYSKTQTVSKRHCLLKQMSESSAKFQRLVWDHFVRALKLLMKEHIGDLFCWKNEPEFDFVEQSNASNYLASTNSNQLVF